MTIVITIALFLFPAILAYQVGQIRRLKGKLEDLATVVSLANRTMAEIGPSCARVVADERGRRIADIREVNERISAAHKAISERVDATILDRVKLLETKVSNIEHGGSDQDRWRG